MLFPRAVYALLSLGFLVRAQRCQTAATYQVVIILRRDGKLSDAGRQRQRSSNNPARRRHGVLRQGLGRHESPQRQQLGGYKFPHRRPFFRTRAVAQAAPPPELVALGPHAATAV